MVVDPGPSPRATAQSDPRRAAAWAMARDWVAAWNARDLERVLRHYAEDVTLCSPLVVERLGRADGRLHGKQELRAYFERGMANPHLSFTLEDVRIGVGVIAVLYRRESGLRAVDMMEMNEAGQVQRMLACYAGEDDDVL